MVERTIVVQGPFEVVEEKEKSGAVAMSLALPGWPRWSISRSGAVRVVVRPGWI